MTRDEYIKMLAEYIVGKYRCPSGVIAQLILECGLPPIKTPKDINTGKESYNLGNIKGTGTNGSVTIWTTEYYNGVKTRVKANFRAYHNYGEAIDDHVTLLKKPRYVRAGVLTATTPLQYATALKNAGYATDPKYVEKIMNIVNKYNLTKYDVQVNKVQPKPQAVIPAEVKEVIELMKYVMSQQDRGYTKTAINNLAKKGLLNSPEDWIESIDNGKVYERLPMMIAVLLDRITNKDVLEKLIK